MRSLHMLILELVGLVLASLGALYGIWTQSNRDNKVAIVATVITAVGLIAVAALAVLKSRESLRESRVAEERRKESVQTAFAGAELTHLRIVWTFDAVPRDVIQMLELGRMIVDTELLRDDEVSRLPQEILRKATAAWHIEASLGPVLHAIESGDAALDSLYKGEPIEEAVARWGDSSKWVEEIGSPLHYVGTLPEVLFPLNPTLNAVLSLGKRADDVVDEEPRLIWQEDYPSLFEQANYGFEATIEGMGESVNLIWSYDQGSLNRAVERPAGAKLTAGLPREFSFVLVKETVDRDEYLRKAGGLLGADKAVATSDWNATSVLRVYVNGLESPHYKYIVTKDGTHEKRTHVGAYDDPILEFEYTRFTCRLESL
jgi:hypothetical protein